MNNLNTRRKLFLTSVLVVLSSTLATVVYTQSSKSQPKTKDYGRTYEAAKVTAAPEVISIIKDLKISSVNLIDQGTPGATVTIDVINNRDEDVMTVDFITGRGKSTTSGLATDGLMDEDSPAVIIPRHSLKTFTWNLGSIMEGETIFLSAAVFSDGKEEGDQLSLNGIKKSRIHYQESRRKEKAKKGTPE